jgi:quercetin dioxygenase-like cupin family protein
MVLAEAKNPTHSRFEPPRSDGNSPCTFSDSFVSISTQGEFMTATTGTGSVLIAALDDIEWQRRGKHRGAGLKMKPLPFRGDGRGNNLALSLAEMEDGWFSPRHMHNFDQIRYVLAGETGFSEWDLHTGECAYFPAGTYYGPQQQHGSAMLLTLQYPGADGQYYLTPEDVEKTVARLRAEDPAFGTGGKGRDKDGRERDSYELMWETHQKMPVRYQDSSFDSPVLFDRNEPVTDEDFGGAEVILIGAVESNGLRVLRVTSTDSLRIAPASPTRTEFWILEDGAVEADGHELRALSVIQLQAGAPACNVTVHEAARFTVLRLPELPPRSA